MNSIDVVIPVHNTVHRLSWCLEELFRFGSARLGRVWVVDDSSDPAQSKQVAEVVGRYQNVEIIPNKGENCFCARNSGARRCLSELILFLNADCLLTDGVLDRLAALFDGDQDIALACPVSNNAPDLSLPLFAGHSYRDMAQYCVEVTRYAEKDFVVEVSKVDQDCLLVCRDFFERIAGFSKECAIGWEVADLHMKALSLGLKGVAHLGCYVFHAGGDSFNYLSGNKKVRNQNHQHFMGKWGREYNQFIARCPNTKQVKRIARTIETGLKENLTIELDVLFYLHGIDQGVGGINAVISICNDLVRMGLKVSCALVGITADRGLKDYKEPVLFNFLYYISDRAFLADRVILPSVVISTVYTAAPVVAQFAETCKATAVQFVQGYDGYFSNGQHYVEATASYQCTEHLVTSSEWLFDMTKRHIKPHQHLQRLPLVINQDIYFSTDEDRDIDVCMVFRGSADKGQWLLAELLDRLVASDKVVGVLCASSYQFLEGRYGSNAHFFNLPLDQCSLARIYRRAKVFVDASLHEGFGLMPLEAALCGCGIVASDSGGVRDFVAHFGGELIAGSPDPNNFMVAIERQLNSFSSSRQVKPLPDNLSRGVGSWCEYIQKVCGDRIMPQLLSDSDKNNPSVNSLEPDSHYRAVFYDLSANIYRRVFPYIPSRLHLALKVLLSGKS